MNTLSRVDIPSPKRTTNYFSGVPQRILQQLQTTTSAGDNVRQLSPELGHDSLSTSERRTKRRKLDPQYNSQKTPHVLDESEDESQLLTDDIIRIRHVSPTAQGIKSAESQSLASHERSKDIIPDGSWTNCVKEYRDVEKLMANALPNDKKRRDREKRKARGKSRTPRSSFASSPTESVETLDKNSPPKLLVKANHHGAANLDPLQAFQTLKKETTGRTTGYRSPHFPSRKPAEIHNPNAKMDDPIDGLPSSDVQLRNQFRDTSGRRRSGADQSSADELMTAESNSRALSPVKTARSQTPAKDSQRHSPIPSSIDDGPFEIQTTRSNIKPAAFTAPVNEVTLAASRSYQRGDVQEKPPPWSLPLHAYYSRGKISDVDGLGLVYNENNQSYDIYHNGTNLAKVHPELMVQPRKLNKIIWAQGSRKIRFESSKTGKVDNILDVEMCCEKDVHELTTVLQESRSITVKAESEATLNKKFEHRRKEQHRAMTSGRISSPKPPEDVLLADLRLKRADNKRAAEEQQNDKPKRRRVVDALVTDGQSDSTSRLRHNQLPEHSDRMVKKPTASKVSSNENQDVDLGPLEETLRRSLRSRPIHDYSSSGAQVILSHMLEEKTERYSKTHDMGKPWYRPLIYPKEGKKRTTVEWDDLERLDEGEFLNDNLIAFYLRYLEIEAEKRDASMTNKVYMFNTFFYERLTSAKPGHKGINYEAVSKWTRGVDLFTYDFVVVPVHESVHWYVAIICNLPALSRKLGGMEDDLDHDATSFGKPVFEQAVEDDNLFSSSPPRDVYDINEHEAATSFAEMSLEPNDCIMRKAHHTPQINNVPATDQEVPNDQSRSTKPNERSENDSSISEIRDTGKTASPTLKKGRKKYFAPVRKFDPSKPTILTFDSFGTPHPATIKILKQYLHEEANDKRGQMEFDEKELQGMTAKEIPQQSNFYDCGLYLLGYMEKFFEDPRELVNKVMRRELVINKDWPKLDPCRMRMRIRNLLLKLHAGQQGERNNERRMKSLSKSLDGTTSSPPTKPQPLGPEVSNDDKEPLPKAAPKKEQRDQSSNKPIEVTQISNALDPLEPIETPKAAVKVFRPAVEDKKPTIETPSLHPSPKEQPPRSFIALDSQPQPTNTTTYTHIPTSPSLSPVLPSTIPDSQPPDTEIIPEREVRPISPPIVKRPRRIDNFSSPLTSPKAQSKRGNSGGVTKSTAAGVSPKVVISID
ncbi:MAG: hypothetical protein Q9219_005753 [cf. Caloplaca sp. 3 TL-2023]